MSLYLSKATISLIRVLNRTANDIQYCGCYMLKSRAFQNSAVVTDKFSSSSDSLPKLKQVSHSRPLHQDGKKSQHVLPQIEVPEYPEFGEAEPLNTPAFKGLETDFPCLTRVQKAGPEPEYDKITTGFRVYNHEAPFKLKYDGGILPHLQVAFETWGELNKEKNNAVLISAGLSASSHAKSHKDNVRPGWWEKFVGPGCAVDTDKFFVICTNNLGGCYGTSGPSSVNPVTGKPYGTTFPIVSVEDMVNAQMLLLDHLGIQKLHASVGSSLGGMCSVLNTVLYPERVGRLISISSCAQSHPSAIALRYLQRKCIMSDHHWNKGHYYDAEFPMIGMKLAREIATLTYRSGPEWNERFGRSRISDIDPPSLCPTFHIENYLEHQGESFSTKFDPNSLLYISKAMDLFDVAEGFSSLEEGLSQVTCPAMIIGVQTDILFPIWQQRKLAQVLQDAGNDSVTFYELNSMYGHDTFLLDLNGVGTAVKGFLETDMSERGILAKEVVKRKASKKTSVKQGS
ncbi:acetyltransferase efuC-like [Haliotis rufescens]|uniref:acetyltransferase efuC-like n=1 Tax=Haliotis rufescens TaxID=6454 RepID=UPI00201FA58F|nr:acetyltransferase efuC-like [Haliotis rufescens]